MVAPMAAAGYKVIGNDFTSLYVVPGLGQHLGQFGYIDPKNLYEAFSFVHAPNVLGYKLARWSDLTETQPIGWVDFFARRPQQVLADRLWGGPRVSSVWQLVARADAIGGPPASQLTAVPKAGSQVIAIDGQPDGATDATSGNVFDDDPYTSWSSAASALPHELTVDLGASYRLGGFRYLPPQDGATGGRISSYQLEVSADGLHWHVAASGQFANDQTEKQAVFPPVEARFVLLRDLTSADGSPAMSVAELTMLRAPDLGTAPRR
jgi:hexosaminidase